MHIFIIKIKIVRRTIPFLFFLGGGGFELSDYLKNIALINNICSRYYNRRDEFDSIVILHVVLFLFCFHIFINEKRDTSELHCCNEIKFEKVIHFYLLIRFFSNAINFYYIHQKKYIKNKLNL